MTVVIVINKQSLLSSPNLTINVNWSLMITYYIY